MSESVLIYDNRKEKEILSGVIKTEKGVRVYERKVNDSKHFMRKYNGYGISKEVFDKHSFGLVRIISKFNDRQERYEIPREYYLANAYLYDENKGDEQYFMDLSDKNWEIWVKK